VSLDDGGEKETTAPNRARWPLVVIPVGLVVLLGLSVALVYALRDEQSTDVAAFCSSYAQLHRTRPVLVGVDGTLSPNPEWTALVATLEQVAPREIVRDVSASLRPLDPNASSTSNQAAAARVDRYWASHCASTSGN
jgi:hypothetical protein